MTPRFQQKLTIPLASRPLIARSALVAQFDHAVTTRRMVVLAAPAGWGKTTLLAQWAIAADLPVAWYTLDAADHDPQRFLDYLLHAVGPFVPGAAELAARIDSSLPQSLAEIAHEAALIIADAPQPFALVLDDLQLLTDGPTLPGSTLVIDLLASLVEYAQNCHMVFASRTVPELRGLVRLIAQQRAAVFDYTLLQFNPLEVQQLAGLANKELLGEEHAVQLAEQFGGWVTGIVLSLERAIHSPYRSSFDGVTNTGQVYAYFAEQVVAPLPPDVQAFLEDTSVLEDLSVERCDRLRGSDDARDYLDLIQRYSLFVSRRGDWLTYHGLFRDFLRARLGQDIQRSRRLLLSAGDLYRDDDDLPRALECYLAARAEQRAIDLLRETVPRFRQKSLHTTIIAAFKRLDENVLLPADLLVEQARVYSDLALWDEAFVAIDLAETTGDAATREEARLIHADMLFLRGDHEAARATLEDVEPEQLSLSLRVTYAVVASRLQLRRGDVAGAIETLERAQSFSSKVDGPDGLHGAGIVADMLGLAYVRQADRRAAQRHWRRADACWRTLGDTGRRAMTLNNLGMLALEEFKYNDARSAFVQGLENARQTARRRTETTLLCSIGELELAEGQIEQALARFDEAYALASRLYIVHSAALAAVSAWWTALIAGDGTLARRWQAAALEGAAGAGLEVRCRATLATNRARRLGLIEQSVKPALELDAVVAHEAALPAIDRAELALQRAALATEHGDSSAETTWQEAERLLDLLLPSLQQRIRVPYLILLHQSPVEHPMLDQAKAVASHDLQQAEAPDSWRIVALGMFACTHNGQPCELSAIYQALLARLLDAGPAGLTVDRLWESVWGDSELSMTALHQALRRLRAQTKLSASARDGLCAIRSPWNAIDYDVRAFETALQGQSTLASLERAVALYRGEFLPGAPSSAALWASARREHLQQRYLDALEHLGQLHETAAPQKALNYYQQIIQIDGCREQTAARLMRLAARLGNRSLVNTTYEHLALALRTLGVTPSQTTSALYQRLVALGATHEH